MTLGGMLVLEIDFKTRKLEKCCNEYKRAVAKWGPDYAKKIFQRLIELRAADTLADMSHLPPPRCHEVDGIRKDCFAVDIIQPSRMLFKIANNPIPKNADGGVDRSKVTSINIYEVEDYHGKQKK